MKSHDLHVNYYNASGLPYYLSKLNIGLYSYIFLIV